MFEAAVVCLALNIYHEARGEPLVGQIAVSNVVINRVNSPKFPNNICDVVKQGEYHSYNNPIKHRCQFSWWCDGKSDKPENTYQWEQSLTLANTVINRTYIDVTEGSLYYHSIKVNPYWAPYYEKVVTIDNHIFYR